MSYAADTKVPVEKSKAEIERTLTRYGADQFFTSWDSQAGVAQVGFRYSGRFVQMRLKLPDPNAPAYARGRQVDLARLEQAKRQKWRALLLVIKAKLEAVESGITSFEDEFLAWTMLPDGSTVGAWAKPQLALAYSSGKMPPMLPGPAEAG